MGYHPAYHFLYLNICSDTNFNSCPVSTPWSVVTLKRTDQFRSFPRAHYYVSRQCTTVSRDHPEDESYLVLLPAWHLYLPTIPRQPKHLAFSPSTAESPAWLRCYGLSSVSVIIFTDLPGRQVNKLNIILLAISYLCLPAIPCWPRHLAYPPSATGSLGWLTPLLFVFPRQVKKCGKLVHLLGLRNQNGGRAPLGWWWRIWHLVLYLVISHLPLLTLCFYVFVCCCHFHLPHFKYLRKVQLLLGRNAISK